MRFKLCRYWAGPGRAVKQEREEISPNHFQRLNLISVFHILIFTRQLMCSRYTNASKKVLFLGMNPGPWGMAQTGVPFGQVNMSMEFLGKLWYSQHGSLVPTCKFSTYTVHSTVWAKMQTSFAEQGPGRVRLKFLAT